MQHVCGDAPVVPTGSHDHAEPRCRPPHLTALAWARISRCNSGSRRRCSTGCSCWRPTRATTAARPSRGARPPGGSSGTHSDRSLCSAARASAALEGAHADHRLDGALQSARPSRFCAGSPSCRSRRSCAARGASGNPSWHSCSCTDMMNCRHSRSAAVMPAVGSLAGELGGALG